MSKIKLKETQKMNPKNQKAKEKQALNSMRKKVKMKTEHDP